MTSFRSCAAAAVLLLGAAGCYSYTPIPSNAAPPGENVRVYVSRSVLDSLVDVLPLTDQPVLRGRVIRQDANQLFLRVPVGARQIGFHSEEIDQEVPIPVRDITQLERRDFNRAATGAFIAGGVGATAVVLFVIMEAYGEREIVEECPDCVDMRLPLLSIPFR